MNIFNRIHRNGFHGYNICQIIRFLDESIFPEMIHGHYYLIRKISGMRVSPNNKFWDYNKELWDKIPNERID